MYTWSAGTYSGVTDSKQRAFAEAEKHMPADHAEDACVAMVQLQSFRTLTTYYEPLQVWTARQAGGRLEWSGSPVTRERKPWEALSRDHRDE